METPQNQKDRTIDQRLFEYRERQRAIERCEAALVKLQEEHKMQSRLDFGIADGEVLSVGGLAELVLKINQAKDVSHGN